MMISDYKNRMKDVLAMLEQAENLKKDAVIAGEKE